MDAKPYTKDEIDFRRKAVRYPCLTPEDREWRYSTERWLATLAAVERERDEARALLEEAWHDGVKWTPELSRRIDAFLSETHDAPSEEE